MVAPVGRSQAYDATTPTTLVIVPAIQPTASRRPIDCANSTPQIAGTIRNENTSSTPAISTELVTTNPNVA